MSNRKSVCNHIVDSIIEKIKNKELKPGDKLPNETIMANEYGVSRIALREALRSLAAKGLIVTRHGEGSFINDNNSEILSDALYNITLLNNGPVLEMLQLRKIMETEAARLCAVNATPEELEKIQYYKVKREEYCIAEPTEENVRKKYEYDRLFHLSIAEGSHNQIFSQFINTIQASLNIHQISFSSDTENVQNSSFYHNEILSALLEHDAQKAGNMMYAHLQQIEKAFVQEKAGSE